MSDIFKLVTHRPDVLIAMRQQALNALEICGGKAESHAKTNCPVDTGRLRNSIGHEVDSSEPAAYIGTNVEYAPYVEFGTGQYYNGGSGGRQSSWGYSGKEGTTYTKGMQPRFFLKKAITEHTSEYSSIIKRELSK